MPYEDDEDSPGSMLVVCVEAFECMLLLLIFIQNDQVCYFFQIAFGRRVIVHFDVAFEIASWALRP